MKNCEYCGRENEAGAAQCRECGTAFDAEPGDSQAQRVAHRDPVRAAAEKRMISGALWCVGGIFVTVMSYLSAVNNPFGGTYLVAWGAIVFGGLRFFQGLSAKNAKPSSEDMGYDALAYGARLETAGRIEEALKVYHTIIEKYPNTGASNDAKKSIESLQAKRG